MIDTLQRRLRTDTQGEVLFDAAARGRYATDASIYQQMPVGVFVPKTPEDVATALAIARDLQVPLLPRGGGTSQCGQTTGAALVIDNSKHLRRLLAFDQAAMTAEVEPGMVLDHLNAALKPHGLWFPVDVSTSAQATHRWHGRQQQLRQPQHRLRQHGAQRRWHQRLAGRRHCCGIRPAGRPGGAGARHRRPVRGLAEQPAPADRRTLAQGAAPGGRLQPRHLPAAERTALHRRRQRQPGAPAGRQRGHAGGLQVAAAAAEPAATRQGAGCRQLQQLLPGDGRGAAHRPAAADGGGTGRPHDDRAEPRRTRPSGRSSRRR